MGYYWNSFLSYLFDVSEYGNIVDTILTCLQSSSIFNDGTGRARNHGRI